MSTRMVTPEIDVRVVEFDELVQETAPGVPSDERDWLQHEVRPRPRVLRGAIDGVGSYELPMLGAAHEPVVADECALTSPETERRGAAAIAWAVAYRDGFDGGHAEGLARGQAEGLAAGTAFGREEAVRAGHTAAAETLRTLETETRRTLAHLEEMADQIAASSTELALQIAELVLEREISASVDPGADAIRRAARLLPDTGAATPEPVIARLHPIDIDRLQAERGDLVRGRALQVLADPNLTPGSCVLEDGATRVDASIPSALARIAAVLDGEHRS